MRYFIKTNGGLLIPIERKPNKLEQMRKDRAAMPQFTTRMFECYYKSDVEKFEKLVRSKLGYWEGSKECTSLNYHNQPSVGTKYICLYQYYEPIEMEALC